MSIFKKNPAHMVRPPAKPRSLPQAAPTAFIDMDKRNANETVVFDLSDEKWFQDPERFWREFKHTGQILVPKDFEKWLIGQDRMKEEFFLNLEEWVRKMKDIQTLRSSGKMDDKDVMKAFLKERPGPYLLYIGQPGTGKSLLIKIANKKLKELYAKYGIKLQDVLLTKNPLDRQKPLVKYTPAGMGKRVVYTAEYLNEKTNLKSSIIRGMLTFLMVMGALALMTAVFMLIYVNWAYDPEAAWWFASGAYFQWIILGLFLLVFPMLVLGLGGRGGGLGSAVSKPGMEDIPAMVVDNGGDPDLFVDMTQGNSAQMYGSIQHDPYQSGGLGTPTHHRMQAGAIHKADGKILYADEIKNFLLNEQIVIEFLTPLENGSYPIRGRGWAGSEGNASLAGETKTPIDAAFFLIAAGNFDALPALNRFPALRNRFHYGNIVMAEDEIPHSTENEIKIAQFLADEAFRFAAPNLCVEAVRLVIGHSRRKASSANKMKLQMRPYIQDIKKAAQLVWIDHAGARDVSDCGCGIVQRNMIHSTDMIKTIDDYARPIEQQILDAHVERVRPFKLISTVGQQIGYVNGLVVVSNSESDEGRTGDVVAVSAWLRKVDDPKRADFIVTGAPTEHKDTWIANSIRTVRTSIYNMYGIDITKEYYVQIAFLQSDPRGMDGPSAGITMTLALMSRLGDPRLPEEKRVPVPIRRDTAVTGTVENIDETSYGLNDVKVGPIGGVFEKVYGAKKWGVKRVLIPQENMDNTYFDRFNKGIIVRGAQTVLQYFDLIRGDVKRPLLLKEGDEYKVVKEDG